jgi:hypothetical protein
VVANTWTQFDYLGAVQGGNLRGHASTSLEWDSARAVILVNVLEEEFQMDKYF